MLNKLLLVAVISVTAISSTAQVQVDFNENDLISVLSSNPVKILNNGRVLSKKGASLIHSKDLESVNVKRDTLELQLKPEALKRLDADKKANYQPAAKKK